MLPDLTTAVQHADYAEKTDRSTAYIALFAYMRSLSKRFYPLTAVETSILVRPCLSRLRSGLRPPRHRTAAVISYGKPSA